MTGVHGIYLGDDSRKPRVREGQEQSHSDKAVETQDSISTRVSGKLEKASQEWASSGWKDVCAFVHQLPTHIDCKVLADSFKATGFPAALHTGLTVPWLQLCPPEAQQ